MWEWQRLKYKGPYNFCKSPASKTYIAYGVSYIRDSCIHQIYTNNQVPTKSQHRFNIASNPMFAECCLIICQEHIIEPLYEKNG